MMTKGTTTVLAAGAAATLLLLTRAGDAAPRNPTCDGLAMMTRHVRLELRDRVDEFYEQLRGAETRFGERRWTNMYESVTGPSGQSVTYLSLRPHPCGHALDVDPDARAWYVLERTYGTPEAARLAEGLDEATVAITVQAVRMVEPTTAFPWRELGAPFISVTRAQASTVDQPGVVVPLVVAEGSKRIQVWMRPMGSLPTKTSASASVSRATADPQVFRFRADLSSRR